MLICSCLYYFPYTLLSLYDWKVLLWIGRRLNSAQIAFSQKDYVSHSLKFNAGCVPSLDKYRDLL